MKYFYPICAFFWLVLVCKLTVAPEDQSDVILSMTFAYIYVTLLSFKEKHKELSDNTKELLKEKEQNRDKQDENSSV